MKTNPIKHLTIFATQWLVFPFFIIATILAMYLVQFTTISPIVMQMSMFMTAIFVVALLERWLPLHDKSHARDKRDGRINLTSFAVLVAVVDPFLKVFTPFVLSVIIVIFGMPKGFNLIPTDWSFISQLLVAILIAELGEYWMHRLGHVSWLWRFHSSHHSSSRMNWLTGFRVHPFNMIYHHFSGIFILMLTGTNELIILTYITLQSVSNVFQHTNVQFRYGVLNYIFSTNELHRWHHSAIKGEANSNYGVVLIVWDLIFGSYYNRAHQIPDNFGLFSGKNYPVNSYWRQLVAPIFWNKWKIAVVEDVDNK